ncbi:hypothetical protein PRIPAC_92716, partial [Pristionchus pacificus]|uniref:Uncharacterized protein n=1 Tax=Pristionchus pacificus TaxID=54126 RepID=A0A2A6BQX8_PRIPA
NAKLESSDPFPQLGIKQTYVPAASSTNIAYMPYSDCLRVRVRLTICGPQLDRLLDVTSPHGRTMRGAFESYSSPRRFQTIPQVGIKHFPQVAIKLDSNLWEFLDSKLIPDTREAWAEGAAALPAHFEFLQSEYENNGGQNAVLPLRFHHLCHSAASSKDLAENRIWDDGKRTFAFPTNSRIARQGSSMERSCTSFKSSYSNRDGHTKIEKLSEVKCDGQCQTVVKEHQKLNREWTITAGCKKYDITESCETVEDSKDKFFVCNCDEKLCKGRPTDDPESHLYISDFLQFKFDPLPFPGFFREDPKHNEPRN